VVWLVIAITRKISDAIDPALRVTSAGERRRSRSPKVSSGSSSIGWSAGRAAGLAGAIGTAGATGATRGAGAAGGTTRTGATPTGGGERAGVGAAGGPGSGGRTGIADGRSEVAGELPGVFDCSVGGRIPRFDAGAPNLLWTSGSLAAGSVSGAAPTGTGPGSTGWVSGSAGKPVAGALGFSSVMKRG
jgi:pilus assembly protein FimV